MKRNLIASLLFACAVILAVASCGHPHSSETTKKGPPPPAEIKDPIISMIMASSIDEKGQLVNPRFSFPQTEKEITAVVYLGNIKGSQLTVTWYKTSDDGDTKLFEHQIQVKSREHAFSVAKNPAGLMSAGTYKVVATLDGQTEDTEFDIIPPKVAPKKTSNNRHERHFEDRDGLVRTISFDEPVKDQSQMRKVATSSGTTSAVPAADGKPPVSGESGSVSQPHVSRPTTSQCDVTVGGNLQIGDVKGQRYVDDDADTVEIMSWTWGVTTNHWTKVYVGAGGVSREIMSYETYTPENGADMEVDPCSFSGGSDLPGAKISLKAIAFGLTPDQKDQVEMCSDANVITLLDDTLAPRLKVVSTPARGSKVKAGDKINLKVTAQERRKGGPWQTGVKIIQVTAQPGGLVKEPWVNPSALPKPCDAKTWEQKYEATYTVPKNPPPIITICAITEDYVGNESSKCANFYTGETWKGTWHQDSNRSYRSDQTNANNVEVMRCNDTWDGTLSFTVGADGTLQGSAIAKLSSPFDCTPDGGRSSVQKVEEVAYTISGHKTATGFELHFKFDHNTPAGVNWGGNVILAEGTAPCAVQNPQPPPVLLDRTTAENVASGRFTSQGSPMCGGSSRDVLALDAHLEVTRQ
jgi:hypothetical protein